MGGTPFLDVAALAVRGGGLEVADKMAIDRIRTAVDADRRDTLPVHRYQDP